jgi:RNase P subunit RPR2
MFEKFFKMLFCKHNWKLLNEEYDLRKGKRAFIYICKICGKEKRVYYN